MADAVNAIGTTLVVFLPILFVIALGYWAGRTRRFDALQVAGINRMVVDYALPAALFVGTARTPRAELLAQGPLIVGLACAFGGTWLVGVVVGRRVFHHTLGASALQATSLAFANVGFAGIAILPRLYGARSVLSIAIGAAVGMLVFIPAALTLLEIDRLGRAAATPTPPRALIAPALLAAVRAPIVWAPALAALLVIAGVEIPTELNDMLDLIGSATAGTAIFAGGLVLALHRLRLTFEVAVNTFFKMFFQPALMAELALVLSIPQPYAREAILMCALPTAILATILAARYQTYEAEAASTLVVTTMLAALTLPLVVAVI